MPPDSASGAFSEENDCQSRDTADHVFVLGGDPEPALVAFGGGRRVEPHRRLAPKEREPLVRERMLETIHVGEIDVAQLHAESSEPSFVES